MLEDEKEAFRNYESLLGDNTVKYMGYMGFYNFSLIRKHAFLICPGFGAVFCPYEAMRLARLWLTINDYHLLFYFLDYLATTSEGEGRRGLVKRP